MSHEASRVSDDETIGSSSDPARAVRRDVIPVLFGISGAVFPRRSSSGVMNPLRPQWPSPQPNRNRKRRSAVKRRITVALFIQAMEADVITRRSEEETTFLRESPVPSFRDGVTKTMRFGVKMNIVSRQSSSRESKSGAFCRNFFFESVENSRRASGMSGVSGASQRCERRPTALFRPHVSLATCAARCIQYDRNGMAVAVQKSKEDTQTKFRRITMRDEDGERNEKFIDESPQKRTSTRT